MSENEIRVLYVQPGKYPEERTIPNTLRALQELVGGDIECCRPWRDSVCVICNDSGKIDGLPPNRLYGHIAQMLSISLRAAYTLCNTTTDFRVLHIGTSIRVSKASFDAWLARIEEA